MKIEVVPGEKEDTWTLKIYETAPLSIENFKINNGSLDEYRSDPSTAVITTKGKILKDSLNVFPQVVIYNDNWYRRWSIKAIKK